MPDVFVDKKGQFAEVNKQQMPGQNPSGIYRSEAERNFTAVRGTGRTVAELIAANARTVPQWNLSERSGEKFHCRVLVGQLRN